MEVLKTIVNTIIGMVAFLLVLMGQDLFLLANPHKIANTWWDLEEELELPKKETENLANYITVCNATSARRQVAIIEKPVQKEEKVDITYTQDEWFPFLGFKYDLDSLNWSERDKILFTNILFRESGSTVISRNHEIDQYFVAISAIRRYTDRKCGVAPLVKYSKKFVRFKNQAAKITHDAYYVYRFVGAFSMASYNKPTFKRNVKANQEAWEQCYKVVTNVLNGTIPNFVPYIPHGTFAYLKKEIDTDYNWINAVTKKWVLVATTIKDHHYYADPDCMTDQEKKHLLNNPFNPIADFSEGLFADLLRSNSLNKE